MIPPDIGYVALMLAFVLALFGLATGAVGAARRVPGLIRSSQHALLATAGLLSLAAAMLWYALLKHDFRLQYVAQTSSSDMDASYLVTSFWGGQAGSLLFWGWMLTLFSAVAVFRSRKRYSELTPYVGATLLAIQSFFLFVLGFVTNPFQRLPVPAFDGQGLNPLLMDPGMRVHPPLLLIGYMSFSIPFAFAVAALITGRLGREWLGAIRRWMLLGWAIQGAGLLLGAWWAYHVLGWGGYWGWDPVENAALMPWLTATAFLHSTMVQERRGMLKVWNLSLVLLTFALAVFGTFVVRSGVLSSVHSFAKSSIGPYFFVFLGAVVIGTAGLVLYRLPRLQTEGQFDSMLSRESSFLVNNLLIIGITGATFWGSVFPLISEVVRGSKISVGPPFYQQVNGPLLLALLLLMGVGPMLAWRRSAPGAFWRNVRCPVLFGLGVGVALFVLGVRKPMAVFSFASVAFVFGTVWLEFWRGTRVRARNTGEPAIVAMFGLISRNRRRYGGYIVHLALLFMALGVISSSFYQQETAKTLNANESVTLGGYTLTNQGLFQYESAGTQVVYADMTLRNGDRDLGTIRPERRTFRNWEDQPVTGVAIRTIYPSGDDVYVLMSGIENGVPSFRVFINPMVSMIWYGGILLILGTMLCGWPEVVRREAVARVPRLEARPSEA
ncbi:MAG: heme lyase CcmF/NrfE family subunit [Chloroflexota bacterium]|nr:heme lyase CcmF/NrfE family subunit [Chloroflexota bacterium]